MKKKTLNINKEYPKYLKDLNIQFICQLLEITLTKVLWKKTYINNNKISLNHNIKKRSKI
jgi:hypothetical protein